MKTDAAYVWTCLRPRPRDSHKGTFEAVLAVAGSASYRGAAALAVEGALRTGAGIVTLASVEPVLAAVSARLPECCLCPCEAGAEGGIAPAVATQVGKAQVVRDDVDEVGAFGVCGHFGLQRPCIKRKQLLK